MLATLRVPMMAMAASLAVAGCAGGTDVFSGFGSGSTTNPVTTSSVPMQAKMDPACPSLSAQIDTLRRDGVAERIEKAAAKKYKMTPADMAKADQLTKANAEFQTKCSTLPRSASVAPVNTTPPAGVAAPAQASAMAAQATKAAQTAVATKSQ